jgi:hypothetical protein
VSTKSNHCRSELDSESNNKMGPETPLLGSAF